MATVAGMLLTLIILVIGWALGVTGVLCWLKAATQDGDVRIYRKKGYQHMEKSIPWTGEFEPEVAAQTNPDESVH